MSAENTAPKGEEETMERNDWIRKREEAGYRWVDLIEAVARLVVTPCEDGVVVDASALLPEGTYFPTRFLLEPCDDEADAAEGWWFHDGSGEAGPLVEQFFTIALICLERPPEATP